MLEYDLSAPDGQPLSTLLPGTTQQSLRQIGQDAVERFVSFDWSNMTTFDLLLVRSCRAGLVFMGRGGRWSDWCSEGGWCWELWLALREGATTGADWSLVPCRRGRGGLLSIVNICATTSFCVAQLERAVEQRVILLLVEVAVCTSQPEPNHFPSHLIAWLMFLPWHRPYKCPRQPTALHATGAHDLLLLLFSWCRSTMPTSHLTPSATH